MRISSAFPGKYVKASDLPDGQDVPVRMAEVKMEMMEQQREEKPVLYFIGKDRGLVLNVTNSNTIKDRYGDETGNWHNQPIVLYVTTTDYGGKLTPCVRVRIPSAPGPAPLVPAPQNDLAEANRQLNAEGDVAQDVPF
jgi:hypothetical protein